MHHTRTNDSNMRLCLDNHQWAHCGRPAAGRRRPCRGRRCPPPAHHTGRRGQSERPFGATTTEAREKTARRARAASDPRVGVTVGSGREREGLLIPRLHTAPSGSKPPHGGNRRGARMGKKRARESEEKLLCDVAPTTLLGDRRRRRDRPSPPSRGRAAPGASATAATASSSLG